MCLVLALYKVAASCRCEVKTWYCVSGLLCTLSLRRRRVSEVFLDYSCVAEKLNVISSISEVPVLPSVWLPGNVIILFVVVDGDVYLVVQFLQPRLFGLLGRCPLRVRVSQFRGVLKYIEI